PLAIQDKDSIKTDEEIERSGHSQFTTRMFVTPISLQIRWLLYTTRLTTKSKELLKPDSPFYTQRYNYDLPP
ncbi:MAG: hypothetical protein ACLU4J_22595, partial [Butyricimonas paravirosa]